MNPLLTPTLNDPSDDSFQLGIVLRGRLGRGLTV